MAASLLIHDPTILTNRTDQYQIKAKRPVGDLPIDGCPLFSGVGDLPIHGCPLFFPFSVSPISLA